MIVENAQAWRLLFPSATPRLLPRGRRRPKGSLVLQQVPGRNSPRLLVDERGWRHASRLYSPTSFRARVGWSCLVALGRAGLTRWFLPRLSLLAAPETEHFPVNRGDSVSFLNGSPGPERKLVAQVVRGGQVLCYAKVTDDETGRWLLGNEADVLRHLDSSHDRRSRGPRVRAYRELGAVTQLLLEPLTGIGTGTQFTQAHRSFLDSMRLKQSSSSLATSAAWSRLNSAAVSDDEVRSELAKESAEMVLPMALTHGDFAPWNLIAGPAGGLVAIDWEYGVREAPVGFDAVHFLVNVGILVQRAGGRGMNEMLRALVNGTDSQGLLPSELQPSQRAAIVRLGLLFDIATGWVATRTRSDLNRQKLELLRSLRDGQAKQCI